MPLMSGSTPEVIHHNISEMIRAGHPHAQAVAAALHNAHPHGLHRSSGGFMPNIPHFDGGGPTSSEMASWFTRREASDDVHESGLFNSSVPGRTDQLAKMVPAGGYVIPADVVSGLGEGNTMAGANILTRTLGSGPRGIPLPHPRAMMGPPHPPRAFNPTLPQKEFAKGGASDGYAPVLTAGGEFFVHPDDVRRLGNGNIKRGHKILDAFIVHARKKIVKEVSKLKGPKKS